MLKPFYVEMKVAAVVVARNEAHALQLAQAYASEIVSDSGVSADSAELIDSLQGLASIDSAWTGDCIPYGGDRQIPLKMLLPETPLGKDTRTVDMFEQG